MKKKEVDKKLHFCRERTARRFSSPRAAIERFKSRDERFPPVRRFHRKLWIPARHRGAVGQIIHVEEKASQVIDGPRRERERETQAGWKRYLGSVDLVVVPEITQDAEGGDPVGGSRAGFLLHDANAALAPQSCRPVVGVHLRSTWHAGALVVGIDPWSRDRWRRDSGDAPTTPSKERTGEDRTATGRPAAFWPGKSPVSDREKVYKPEISQDI